MQVTQVYEILNDITKEILGETAIVNEDLSNVVEIGESFQNVGGLDNFVRSLNDHIGRMVFVNRVYGGRAPRVLMDGWEFGSILEKVRANMPEAAEDASWDLQDGQSYDPNVFYKPSVEVTFWNHRVTFEIPISLTERQVKSAFSNATQLNAFFSMIQTAIQNSMTVKLDSLIMRTINAGIGETMADAFSTGNYGSGSTNRAVNLLYLYNTTYNAGGTALAAADAMSSKDFLRFAAYQLMLWSDRLEVISRLFNVNGTDKFTPKDRQRIVLLSEFKRAADVYLQSDTFHDELTRLPASDAVTYWQGSGTGYAFADTSKIDIKTPTGKTVAASGILGVIFDRDALGVANLDRRVTTNYNPKAEFWNQWHKMDAGYFLDMSENMVVFYVADAA